MLAVFLAFAATAAPAAPEAHAVERAFVHASALRLRPEPRLDTAYYSELAINTPVVVVSRADGWAHVTTLDGADGYVKAEFLAADWFTPETAAAEIAAAPTPEARLGAWQRAAALQPTDPAVLAGLAGAYRAAGHPAEAARVEAVMAEHRAEFDAVFAAQTAELDAVGAALQKVATADDWVAVWRRANAVAGAMAEPLNTLQNGAGGFRSDPGPVLAQRVPWAQLQWVAEGTWAILELPTAFWAPVAARTPEPWDDALLALVDQAYGSATPRGWAAWQAREWDYGGCSPFGTGGDLHLALLKRTDALAGRDPAVAEIRADVLADVVKNPAEGEFPFCVHMGEPTPLAGLQAEAAAILAQVNLTPAERAAVQARVDARFGF